jgi:hypothetical protein
MSGSGLSLREESAFAGLEVVWTLFTAVVSLAIVALLACGGWLLRTWGMAGKAVVQTGLAISVAAPVLFCVIGSLLVVAAVAHENDPLTEPTPVATVAIALGLLLGLGAWAFEVIALIWLVRQGRDQPGGFDQDPPSAPDPAPTPWAVPDGPVPSRVPPVRARYWVSGGGYNREVIVLSRQALCVGTAPEADRDWIEESLRQGKSAEGLLRAVTRIPLSAIQKVKTYFPYPILTVVWQSRSAPNAVTAIDCADRETRDEVVAALRARLGPGWCQAVRRVGWLDIVKGPLALLASSVVVTGTLYAGATSGSPPTGGGAL